MEISSIMMTSALHMTFGQRIIIFLVFSVIQHFEPKPKTLWMVAPPMRRAAIPVGAQTINCFPCLCSTLITSSNTKLFPVPAYPVINVSTPESTRS